MMNNSNSLPTEFFKTNFEVRIIRILKSISAVLLTFLLSCNPTNLDDCRPNDQMGNMNARINGDVWEAYPFGLETSIVGIIGNYYYKPSCRLEQIIGIELPYKKKGVFQLGVFQLSDKVDTLNNQADVLFSFVDADLLLAHYKVREGQVNGSIEITSYNPDTRKIVGNFQCTLYPFRNYGLDNPPDSLVITDGQFETYFPK